MQRVAGLILFVLLFIGIFVAGGIIGSYYPQSHDISNGQKALQSFWEKTESEPVATFTAILAAVTGVLVLISSIQIYFLTRADKTSRISANAAQQSAKIAKEALVDAERPYIFAYELRGFDEDIGQHEETYPYLQYSVMNYGRTPAIIEFIETGFFTIKNGETQMTTVAPPSFYQLPKGQVIAPGAGQDQVIYSSQTAVNSKKLEFKYPLNKYGVTRPTPLLDESTTLYFVTRILYRGSFTGNHETCACWRYHADREVFFTDDEHSSQR